MEAWLTASSTPVATKILEDTLETAGWPGWPVLVRGRVWKEEWILLFWRRTKSFGQRRQQGLWKGQSALTDMLELCGGVNSTWIEVIHCIVQWSFKKLLASFHAIDSGGATRGVLMWNARCTCVRGERVQVKGLFKDVDCIQLHTAFSSLCPHNHEISFNGYAGIFHLSLGRLPKIAC